MSSLFKLFLPSIIMIAVVVIAGLYVWIMDPILHFTQSPGIDLNNKDSYLVVDKYEQDPDVQPGVNLTVVFPAYNEEYRLGSNIEGAIHYLDEFCMYRNWTYEILVVDDGSSDDTAILTMKYFDEYPDIIRLVSLTHNVGKGGAVRVGMENAHGKYILMADADGATDISDLDHLFMYMQHLEIEAAHGVHKGPAGMNVQDTQCGFKLFTKEAAKLIFPNMHTRRWAFDIEMIIIAESLGIPIKEVPVNWREVEGSKLIVTKMDIVTTSLTMARDIIAIRLAYLLGYWQLPVLPAEYSKAAISPVDEL
eukprot:gene542-367_t